MKRFAIRALPSAMLMLMLLGCSSPQLSSEQTPDPSTTPTAAPSTPNDAASTPSAEPSTPATSPTQDPELAAQLKPLIVGELPPVSLYRSSNVAADCGVDSGGCYVADKAAIYIASDRVDFRRPEILAHEYLHWVWEQRDLESDSKLVNRLKDLAKNDEGLGSLVPSWQTQYVGPDGEVEPNELFAYACTGLRAEQMAGPVGQRCGEFVQLSALPVAQSISVGGLLDAVDSLRQEAGQQPLKRNPNAAAASQARADLFTPQSQTPLNEFPESVTRHFDAGCRKPSYGARLTRPSDPKGMAEAFDKLLKGELTGTNATGIGVATRRFDYIDATKLFGERTLKVNATVVVVTICR